MTNHLILSYAWPVLFFAGVGTRILLNWMYGARGPARGDAVYGLVKLLSWVMILAGLAPALLVSGVSVVGWILLFFAAATLLELLAARRGALRKMTAGLLAMVASRKQSIGPAVAAAATQQGGRVARQARRLLQKLEAGAPLAEAINSNRAALPREALAYVAVGDVIGDQARALDELARPDDPQLTALLRSCTDRLVYLASIVTVMALVTFFVMHKIIPEMQKIYLEFDLDLPPLTVFVVGVSSFVGNYLGAFLLIGFGSMVLAVPIILWCYIFDRPILRPIADRVFRTRRVSEVLRLFALAAERNCGFDRVADCLAGTYPAGNVRRPLRRMARQVQAGSDWRDALLNSRLIRVADHALLGTAEHVGNLPWALRTIARRGERRLVYRLATVLNVAYPLTILAFGTATGLFVAGMFLPLVQLIEALA